MRQPDFQSGKPGTDAVRAALEMLGFTVWEREAEKDYVDLWARGHGRSFGVQVKYKRPFYKWPVTGYEAWRHQRYLQWQRDSGTSLLVVFAEPVVDDSCATGQWRAPAKLYGDWLDALDASFQFRENFKERMMMMVWDIAALRTLEEIFANP